MSYIASFDIKRGMIFKIKNKRVRNVIVLYLIIIILVALAMLYAKFIDIPICPIRRYTGLSCPTCGVTRMVKEIITTGDLYQAFRYNPYMFIMMPVTIIISIVQTISYLKHGTLTKSYDTMLSIIVISAMTFGILRNIPMLYWLLPTKI